MPEYKLNIDSQNCQNRGNTCILTKKWADENDINFKLSINKFYFLKIIQFYNQI